MTDPSTLFLNGLQVRPSWIPNGLTLALNVAPTQVSNGSQTEVGGDSVFAITQSAAFLSSSILNNGISAAAPASATTSLSISKSVVTNSLMTSDTVSEQSLSTTTKNCGAAGGLYVPSSVTIAEDTTTKKSILQNSTQLQLPAAKVDEKSWDASAGVNPFSMSETNQSVASFTAAIMSTNDQKSCSQSVRLSSVKKVAIGAPCQVTDISTSNNTNTNNNFQDSSAMIQGTQSSSTFVTSAAIAPAQATVNSSTTCHIPALNQAVTTRITSSVPSSINGSTASSNIPVGIAVARQRYVSSTSCKSQTQNLKETMTTSSSNTPYMSTVPYHQPILEPSLFPQSIANIGVVAGTTGCDDRTMASIGGNIFPSIIAWPPQQQQLQPWYPCVGSIETAPQNVPPASGYQLVRDPVNGHILLIPTNQIGSTQSSGAVLTSANQQIQSFIIPPHYHHQQQSQTHSVFLDHLVSIVPSSTNTKQNSLHSSTLLKLNDGVLTGVMMPCDMGKSATVNPSCATSAIGQQVISANNSSISLVHQFNSSNIQNTNINSPHHFSSISSSGSLLIQQISGNTGQPPVINHINNSVMIAESTAMQSVINTQPSFPANGASYLINSQVSTENSTTMNQVQQLPTTCIVSNNSHPQQPSETLSQQLPSVNSENNLSCDNKPDTIQLKVNTDKQQQQQVLLESKPINDQVCVQQYVADKSEEKAEVIQVGANSSVQDASNQTEYNEDEDEDDDDDDDDDRLILNSEDEPEAEEEQPEGDLPTNEYEETNSCRKVLKSKQQPQRKVDEKKVYSDENPDFSGLQLLLNGIERAEHCSTEKDTRIAVAAVHTESAKEDTDDEAEKPAPNGLEILCALADQRFQEVKNSESDADLSSSDDTEKKRKLYKNLKSYKREARQSYKHLKSDKDTRHFLSSKHSRHRLRSLSPCDGDQMQMHIELAELQRKYREARKELNRLTRRRKYAGSSSRTSSPAPAISPSPLSPPITGVSTEFYSSGVARSSSTCTPVKRKPGRPRKYSDNQQQDAKSRSDVHKVAIKPMKRPKLKLDTDCGVDGSEEDVKVANSNNGDLSPPVLEPMCTSPKEKSFKINDILSPPTLIANKKLLYMGSPKGLLPEKEHKRPSEFKGKSWYRLTSDESSDEGMSMKCNLVEECRATDLIPITQKRKVGRPRKYPTIETPSTEQWKICRKSTGGSTTLLNKTKEKGGNTISFKSNEKQIPVTSSVVSTLATIKLQRKSSDVGANTEVPYKPKITPKLKAEAKLRTWRQESPEPYKNSLEDFEFKPKKRKCEPLEIPNRSSDEKNVFGKSDKFNPKETSLSGTTNIRKNKPPRIPPCIYRDEDFRVTPELLDSSEKCPLRVLISVGGLFRAGELSGIRPPDIYGIKLDGERGQRIHFYTKEEILTNVVREVKGKYPLSNGTRVCAFWSSQYLSLYPGYVTADESEDDKFTAVEFDDGDSGRINMNDIRVLPKDFSVTGRLDERDSCFSESDLKRRTSSLTDEIPVDKKLRSPERIIGHHRQSTSNVDHHVESSPAASSTTYSVSSRTSSDDVQTPTTPPPLPEVCESGTKAVTSEATETEKKKNGERKRLKKKHKDKMKQNSDASCKRKSHKHKSDTDEGLAKARKRHKHKHKHHKHHKRKRSSTGRKYGGDGDRVDFLDKSTCKADAKAIKTGNIIYHEESDWPYVPPYSDHLTDVARCNLASSSNVKESTKPSILKIEDTTDDISSASDEKVIEQSRKELETNTNAIKKDELFVETKGDKRDESKSENEERRPKTADDGLRDVLEASSEQTNGLTMEEEDRCRSSPSQERQEENSSSEDEYDSDEKFWDWNGKGFKRNGKGRARKEFYKSIKRKDEVINVGDCAVFLTAGASAKPFIGRIESMWESYGSMMVRVNWFYHPEETTGLTQELPYLGALFESPHTDKNEVQTISHKCQVVPIAEYRKRLEEEPERIRNVYESNDLYYLAGYYDPTAKRLTYEDGVVS